MGLFKVLGTQCTSVVRLLRTGASDEIDAGAALSMQRTDALGIANKPCWLFGLLAYRGIKNCRIILFAILLGLGLASRVAVADIAVSTEGITSDLPATGSSSRPSISGDGRYVAFLYTVTSIVNGQSVAKRDVFVHDRVTGTKRRVTSSPTGELSNGTSINPVISRDGRYIVFTSSATNLIFGKSGVFVYDQMTQTMEWIASGTLRFIGISFDGRYVAYMDDVFESGRYVGIAVFVRDRVAQTTQKLHSALQPFWVGFSEPDQISISDDGRYISYVARGLDSSDANVFVYDRATGTSEKVDVNSAEQAGNGTLYASLSMSSDGRFVAFESDSTNLVANDTNNARDVFVRDRSTGTTERVSVSSTGEQRSGANNKPDLSADGRHVVFSGGDGLFVHDRVTKATRHIVQTISGQVARVFAPSISADGRYIAYEYTSATSNGSQIAVADLGSPAGVTLSSTALTLTEGGAADTYTMALASTPTANVTVTVSPNPQLSASPTQLVFTPGNWNVPQTVTVQAIENGIAEGKHTATISHMVSSSDPAYNGISVAGLTVTVSDAVIPVANLQLAPGAVWTQPGLPATGTAAPGATVTVTATNLTTGMVTAMSAVADANGAWSLTLIGLTNGNYELQPEAGGITGGKLTFAVGITGSSPRSTLFLTGAAVYDINGSGAYIGNGWDTTGNNSAANLYLLTGSGSFLNSGNGTATSLSLDISNPGTYKFLYRADGGGFNWPTPFAGLNLFFNKNSTPGISASVPFNVSNPTLTAFGNGSLGIVNADIVPGANSLSFMVGDLKVTLTAFSLIDYRNPSIPLANPNIVSLLNNVPDGLNDYSGVITLQVSSAQASSDSLRPVLLPPVAEGGVWTQANVPLRGTAPPGATVTIHIKGLHNGETSTRTVVAADDGTWSLLLPDLEDCHYELQAEVNGLFGNLLIVNVDSHAPMTTLSVGLGGGGGGTGGASVGGWNTGPVTIGLSAVDGAAGQGVARIEYSLDGSAWSVFPGTGLTLGQDGTYNFCYRSTDQVGNVEQAHCVPLMIDATAPTVTPRFDAARNLLSLDAVDGGSGIASLESSLDGGQTWTSSTGTVGFPRDGRYTVFYRCRDKAGNVTTGQTTVTVVTLPSLSVVPDQSAIEGRVQTFTLGSFADQGSDSPWQVDIDWGDGSNHDVQTVAAPGSLGGRVHTYADNGMYTVTLKVTDAAGNTGSKSFRVAVTNVAPVVGLITAPSAPVAVNEAVTIRADFSDPGVLDTHTATIDWGDGTAGSGSVTEVNGSGSVAGTHSYAAPGLYTVKVTVTDKDGGAGSSSYRYVVVVDREGGFVTGGGQVDLPEGPAQFDFVVNYKGQEVPSGNGQFKLTSGQFDFRSSGYDWLVATAGKAMFAGSGTINGAGDYGYMVSMIDAGSGRKSADALRIRIWNKADGAVMYDTQPGAAETAEPTLLFRGGNITIHK